MTVNPDLQFILPEIVLMLFAFGALMWGGFTAHKERVGVFALLGVLCGGLLLPQSLASGTVLFSGMLSSDGFSLFFRGLILAAAGIVILFSLGSQELDREDSGEYYFFLLILTLAMMLAAASNSLIMIYVTVEAVSIISYILAGYLKKDIFSTEAGVKYFLFGALSTGVMLYGISLIYGLFGTLDLAAIAARLPAAGSSPVLLVSLVLVLAGLGFKCALAPFHMWVPDVYQGAPRPVAALLSVGPKAAGFALLLRVFVEAFGPCEFPWRDIAGGIAILTMTIGNVMAIRQTNIKRLLAYSSIAQAGYILAGLAVGSTVGVQATLFYLCVYVLMNLGAFGAVIMIANTLKSDAIEDYAGFYKRDFFSAIVLTVALCSLAGLPPLAGFLAKFFVLAAAVEAKAFFLAIVVGLNSIAAVFYYLKPVKFVFLREPLEMTLAPQSSALRLVLLVLAAGNIVIGIWPQPVFDFLTRLVPLV